MSPAVKRLLAIRNPYLWRGMRATLCCRKNRLEPADTVFEQLALYCLDGLQD